MTQGKEILFVLLQNHREIVYFCVTNNSMTLIIFILFLFILYPTDKMWHKASNVQIINLRIPIKGPAWLTCTDLYVVMKGSIRWKPGPLVVVRRAPPLCDTQLESVKSLKQKTSNLKLETST